ncbi:hypothetical protein [Janibacter terrae]|uniref:hypothetical protein n=1 Tax=Janibacter terrae TaxID=103817 RepID=UPI0031F98A27
MYAAIWRRLPGPTAVKVVEALVLLVSLLVVLAQWVFPWVASLLPPDATTVG